MKIDLRKIPIRKVIVSYKDSAEEGATAASNLSLAGIFVARKMGRQSAK